MAGDDVEIVPKPAAAAANRIIKRRQSKWTTTASLRVAEQGLKHQCWQVVGRKTTVPQRWKVAIAEMTTGAPWDIVFKPFTASAIISRFNNMVNDKSSRDTEVSSTTGGGQDGSENRNEETKKLDKVLGQIMVAKAGLTHDKEIVQEKEKTSCDINNAAGLAEEKNAEQRCAPGAGATAFADVLKTLERMIEDTTQTQDDSVRLQMQRDALKKKWRQEDRDEAERIRKEERKEAKQIRKEEMQQAELRRKEERNHDRILRRDEWDAERIERKAERRAEREDRKEERAHELVMLQLQLELAKAQARSVP